MRFTYGHVDCDMPMYSAILINGPCHTRHTALRTELSAPLQAGSVSVPRGTWHSRPLGALWL